METGDGRNNMTRSLAELKQYLAGEWLFDNDFQDTSGNDNHGTPTDIEWKPTSRGMKPRFNGSSSNVNCGNNASLELLQDVTLSAWVKRVKDGNHTLISKKYTNIEFRLDSNDIVHVYKSNGSGGFEDYGFTGVFDFSDFTLVCVTFSAASKTATLYVNGVFSESKVFSSASIYNDDSSNVFIGTRTSGGHRLNGVCASAYIHKTELTTTEILAFYNETKGEYGVMPAEHSFTHNPDDVIDASDAVGAWGTAKESTTELVDLSGHNNKAAIKGPMPTEGFIQGRRFEAANENYLDCGNDSSLDTDSITIISILNPSALGNYSIYSDGSSGFSGSRRLDYELSNGNQKILFSIDGTAQIAVTSSTTINANKYNCLIATYDQVNWKFDIDGVNIYTSPPYSGALYEKTRSAYIGLRREGILPMDGLIAYTIVLSYPLSSSEKITFFNTLARLPFWSVNYTDYPDNVTEYTDNLPYSSSIISSGTFKVDDDKLQCVSAGTITYSASYEFDGSEYIKVEIGGVEYAGTGTITQGNTTVSVAQGSNKVTIAMGTADTIDNIDIQFREEV